MIFLKKPTFMLFALFLSMVASASVIVNNDRDILDVDKKIMKYKINDLGFEKSMELKKEKLRNQRQKVENSMRQHKKTALVRGFRTGRRSSRSSSYASAATNSQISSTIHKLGNLQKNSSSNSDLTYLINILFGLLFTGCFSLFFYRRKKLKAISQEKERLFYRA